MTFDVTSFISGAWIGTCSIILFFAVYHLASHGAKRQLPFDIFGYWAHGEWRKDWQDTYRVKETKHE